MITADRELIQQLIPHWYASRAWACELLIRTFRLNSAADILGAKYRGKQTIPGSLWTIRTHGIGIDIFKTPNVGGIDFDFDKPDPDPWRLGILFHRLLNDQQILYEEYRHFAADEELLEQVIQDVLGGKF
ncbi:MAG: hypothetical protein JWM11_3174 [Planctomycetaceae bacterium]|nr:hypothetical protein [Planctomycetaceae bacterium]